MLWIAGYILLKRNSLVIDGSPAAYEPDDFDTRSVLHGGGFPGTTAYDLAIKLYGYLIVRKSELPYEISDGRAFREGLGIAVDLDLHRGVRPDVGDSP